jgi:recombination associated protein RdgC
MWFKNLLVYRFTPEPSLKLKDWEEKLQQYALQPCGSFEMECRGWVAPHSEDRFLHNVERQWLIALGVNQRLLPATVINQTVKERAAVLAAKQEHPVGRKQMRDIRERVIAELMPKAFTRRRTMHAWIDPVNGWLVANTAAEKKADELIELLRKSEIELPLKRLNTRHSPAAAMTQWLSGGNIAAHFSIDQDLELRATDRSPATIRYSHHALDGREIRDHINAGKTAARLGMTWKDRISFVLTEQFQIKRLAFLEVLRAETEGKAEDADEQFDADFALMTGELTHMLADLTTALGGEQTRNN